MLLFSSRKLSHLPKDSEQPGGGTGVKYSGWKVDSCSLVGNNHSCTAVFFPGETGAHFRKGLRTTGPQTTGGLILLISGVPVE